MGGRVRVVEGSCWACRKRRIKCDLTRPKCRRCAHIGAPCQYSDRHIRWKNTGCAQLIDESALLASRDEQALGYFKDRLWPLLTTSAEPCASPISLALENKTLLLATCLLADTHRVLQDGRNNRRAPQMKRLECLSAVRGELQETCETAKPPSMTNLLMTVLLLYFDAGYLDCTGSSGGASTASHHAGVNAIINRLGGIGAVLDSGPAALHMLVSEFASTDLSRNILASGRPSFPPDTWDVIDRRSVWWTRDTVTQRSLASVLRDVSGLAHHRADVLEGLRELDPAAVAAFQEALMPTLAPQGTMAAAASGNVDLEAVDASYLVRSFQYLGLIFLCRAIYGLSVNHILVQQHVQNCLECIFSIKKSAKVLNCIILPLLVAGAHSETAQARRNVSTILKSIHCGIKFASFLSVSDYLEYLWRRDSLENLSWDEMFSSLNPDALIL